MAETIIKHVSAENLKQYDGLIKQYLETKDAAVKAALEEQIDIVAQAIQAEENRAKGEESKNATAAANAQAKGEEALAHSQALAGKVGEVPADKTVVGMIEEAQTNATYDDTEVRGLISGLDTNKADKTAVAADKQELEGKINLKADQTALDEVSGVANAAVKQSDYNVKVKALEDEDARIAGLVAAETERASGIEGGLRTDVDAIKGDYLKASDKQELQGNIDTVSGAVERLTNGVSAEEIDGVNDLIQYVEEHGTEVTGMKADIKANADAVDALEGLVGEKSVQTQISEAITAQNLGQYATDSELAAATDRIAELEGIDHEAYKQADTTLLNTVNGSIAEVQADADKGIEDAASALAAANAASAHADELNTAMNNRMVQAETDLDAVEAKASANEGAIGTLNTTVATKAAQADLEAAIARIEANEGFIESLTFMSESDINSMFQA